MPDIFDASKRKPKSSSHHPSKTRPVKHPVRATSSPAVKHVSRQVSKDASKHTHAETSRIYNRDKNKHENRVSHHHRSVKEYSAVMKNEKPSRSAFDSFAPNPLYIYHFDTQLGDEPVLLLLRKHPVTQVGKIVISLILIIMSFFIMRMPFFIALPGRFQIASVLFWYLITVGFILESFLTWFYNVYIITDERIIDVDFLSLIYKNISSAKIENIEDVTATTGGALQSIFNFGTVKIQTAAANAEFEFEHVPQPGKVTQFLNEMVLEEEREKIEGRVR